jgi:putative ABC transport system permease protein
MHVDAAMAALDGRADVADWATLGFSATETVAGQSVLSIVDVGSSSSAFTVVRGRAPRGPGEIAVGALTADDLGLHIGDTVDLAGDTVDPHPVTVTGVVVLPALGPFAADRAGPGLGILLPQESIRPNAVDQLATFVGIRLTPDANADEVAGWLRDGMAAWETKPGSTEQFAAPVRPPEIVNAGSVRSIPELVGFLFAAATLTELGSAIALSVRSRRRELGTLRALGFTRRQLHRSVGVQAVATMAAALAISIPFGVVLGRVAWRAFADRLGVLTDPSTSLLALLAASLGALVIAWVVSLPGQAVATGNQLPLRRE